MTDLFIHIINLSINAIWAVILMLLIRIILRKVSKRSVCLLWATVGMAFVIPLRIPFFVSPGSLVAHMLYYAQESASKAVSSVTDGRSSHAVVVLRKTIQSIEPRMIISILAIIWVVGLVYFMLKYVFFCFKVRNQLAFAAVEDNGAYHTNLFQQSFLFGIFRPNIVIAGKLSKEEEEMVLKHEKEHLRHGDSLFVLLASLIRYVHWFNPVAWCAFNSFREDLEMACDEAVLKNKTSKERKRYANLLLDLSANSKRIPVSLAFGTGTVEKRISNILLIDKKQFNVPIFFIAFFLLLSFSLSAYPQRVTIDNMTNKKGAVSDSSIDVDIVTTNNLIDIAGKPGFIDPNAALKEFCTKYALELEIFQFMHLLPPLDNWSTGLYWRAAINDSSSAISSRIISFLDIYENSF